MTDEELYNYFKEEIDPDSCYSGFHRFIVEEERKQKEEMDKK